MELDIEGNQRAVIDAKDRVVMRYAYDMLGTRIHQTSMEAGERWMLNDVAGNLVHAWDSRGHHHVAYYDKLRRPKLQYVGGYDSTRSDPRTLTGYRLVGKTDYGEDAPDAAAHNLRGRVHRLYDGAGLVTSEDYDFKGNLLSSTRQLAQDYKGLPDWFASVPLDPDIYRSSTVYDALNRPVAMTAPDGSVIRPEYNDAGLLERMEANLRGAATPTAFIDDIDYDAKGQREAIFYGNGVRTDYTYDPLTFRLKRLHTLRGSEALQDLNYTYDPAGNITHIRDEAKQTCLLQEPDRRSQKPSTPTMPSIG